MFSVYGVSGRLFRGSMEHLRQIGPLGAVARAHHVEPIKHDGREEGFVPTWADTGAAALPVDEPHRSAVAAYTKTQRGEMHRHPLRRVDDVMSQPVITLSNQLTVLQAWQQLASLHIGQAPVVDEAAVLVGLLSRADLLRPERLPAAESSSVAWRALLAMSVVDVMTTPVPSVAPETDIRRVARVLLDTGLPGIAVADEQGQVIGFVSRSDILRAVVTDPPLDLWG
ncbi:HPP family protein [Rhodoferax sp.]|uniref:CBS domain-containing protein n=1 Tax=Rhodoferax sp. TaxID=50421 RepID=UPI00277233EC|nr:CBS domain-containing protein [Rhodoferax sp.]